jgi:ABC-type glycerol-3-phosphate transport system substrate-binding protein
MNGMNDRIKKISRAAVYTALLLALLTAGVFLYPWKLKPYDEVGLLRDKPAPWQGVLNVWQINDWRVGAYSRTLLVQNTAKRFEKANIGLFVEFENVSPELFAQRLAAGGKPDVLSFPDGWAGIPRDLLLDLGSSPLPPVESPFRKVFNQESKAVPWMAGGMLVLTNSGVGRAVGVEPPQADNTFNAAALLDYAGRAATGRRKKPVTAMAGASPLFEALALEGVALTGLQSKALLPEKAYMMSIDQARGVYTTGKCAVLLCTQWEAGVMGRLAAKNKAFDYALLPWPEGLRPCLSVQFVSALKSGNDSKDGMEVKFIASLLSQTTQKDVAIKACCLSVVALPEDAYPQGEVEKMIWAELPTAHVPLPLVARDNAAIAAALGGDQNAVQKTRERFAN